MDIRVILLLLIAFNVEAARIGTTSPMLEITLGKRAGYENKMLVAHNDTVGTTEENLWDEGGLINIPTAATTMTVSSNNANDIDTTGTGCRKVLVQGLDATYAEISETINMNGTTAVTTTNSYLRISNGGLTCTETGSSEWNEGILYIGVGTVTAGKPATVYNLMAATESVSHVGLYTVPAGKTAVLSELFFTVDAGKTVEVIFKGRLTGANQPWITFTSFNVIGATAPRPSFGVKFDEKTDLIMNAEAQSGTANVKVTGLMTIVDN